MSTPAVRRFFLLGILVFATFLAWFFVERNPNVEFRRFKKAIAQDYQAQIAPLSKKEYVLNISEPPLLEAEHHFYRYYSINFRPNNASGLNEKNKADWQRLKNQMQDKLLEIKQLRSDPSLYNLGGVIKTTLVRKNTTSEEKWQRLERQLQEAPWYYTVAKDNLVHPDTAKTRLAMDKQLLTLQLLQTELLDSLSRSKLKEPQRQSILTHHYKARIAVKDYLAFCRSILFESQNGVLN